MKYLYRGPISGVTFPDGTEVMLFPDTVVDLPAENEYVQTMITNGYLTPVKEEEPKYLSKKNKKEVGDAS